MNSISFLIILLSSVSFLLAAGENPNLFRHLHSDKEILKSRKTNFGEEVGIPLVFDGEKKSFTETGVPETRTTKDNQKGATDKSVKATSNGRSDKSPSGVSKNDTNSRGDDQERMGAVGNKKNGRSEEEMGSGYDNIGDMGSGKDDDESSEAEDTGSGSDEDEESVGDKEDSKKVLDLNGEFPPSADQVSKLPKDAEMTPEEFDRKMADKRKGYMQFTVRQRFKPEFKYKESPGYKIMAGNVIHDVERALETTGVVKDVLFREAKSVGGPPFTSKVQVYLKLKNVRPKRLKKIIDYGLINGMIVVPGSFRAM